MATMNAILWGSPLAPALCANSRPNFCTTACSWRRMRVIAAATASESNRPLPRTRREMLMEYVQNVQPEFTNVFVKKAPQQVVEAMRQTVTNMLGTLPPQFFEITVTTVAENLAQLMYSVIMTGYMFKNAQCRLELQQSLDQAALPSSSSSRFGPDYEDRVQKTRVSGKVLKWHKQDGAVDMDAVDYIELLESEVEKLQLQLEQSNRTSRGRNHLLEYLKSLEPKNLQELTTSAGEDAVEAMNSFIHRLLSVSDPAALKNVATETSAKELARLLYWLMVVGYSIRNIEVRYDMERILGLPSKLAELPPVQVIRQATKSTTRWKHTMAVLALQGAKNPVQQLNLQTELSRQVSRRIILKERFTLAARLHFKLEFSLVSWRTERRAFTEALVYLAFLLAAPMTSSSSEIVADDLPQYGPEEPKTDFIFRGPVFMAIVGRKTSLVPSNEEEVLELSLEVPRQEVTAFDVFLNLPSASQSSSITVPEYVGSYGTEIDTRSGFRKAKARFGISDKIKLLKLENESSLLVALVRRGNGAPIVIVSDIEIEME